MGRPSCSGRSARIPARRRIGAARWRAFTSRLVGRTLHVVLEPLGAPGAPFRRGVSELYVPVWVPAGCGDEGALVPVRVEAMLADGSLRGRGLTGEELAGSTGLC